MLTAGWGSLCALTIWSAQAAPPEIYLIERLGSNLVTIHFNTEANRKYQLQFINSYTCPTNLPGNSGVVCNSSGVPINLWSNLYVAPIIPTVSHYVIADTVTNRQRFYRLRVTP